jgi:hypothetical protein
MKIIRENKMVCHAKAVRLHGMVWPKVNTTHITVVKVRDSVLGAHVLKRRER